MIQVISTIQDLTAVSDKKRSAGLTIGFVPTMGALHEGHLSLVSQALEMTDWVVVSIYVNPLQFGPGEDFKAYPRDLETDFRMLDETGAHTVFTPDDGMLYPDGYSTYVTVEGMTEGLCGLSRPTHFRGVATIVTKLFNIVKPHMAFFGQKDAQQLLVIRRMVRDLNVSVEIIPCPIVRESDGLAMSSRNRYLNHEERTQAAILYRSLEKAKGLARAGERRSGKLIEAVQKVLETAPLAVIDYIDIVDTENLKPVEDVTSGALLAIAVRIGRTRLIDNVLFEPGRQI